MQHPPHLRPDLLLCSGGDHAVVVQPAHDRAVKKLPGGAQGQAVALHGQIDQVGRVVHIVIKAHTHAADVYKNQLSGGLEGVQEGDVNGFEPGVEKLLGVAAPFPALH